MQSYEGQRKTKLKTKEHQLNETLIQRQLFSLNNLYLGAFLHCICQPLLFLLKNNIELIFYY